MMKKIVASFSECTKGGHFGFQNGRHLYDGFVNKMLQKPNNNLCSQGFRVRTVEITF